MRAAHEEQVNSLTMDDLLKMRLRLLQAQRAVKDFLDSAKFAPAYTSLEHVEKDIDWVLLQQDLDAAETAYAAGVAEMAALR